MNTQSALSTTRTANHVLSLAGDGLIIGKWLLNNTGECAVSRIYNIHMHKRKESWTPSNRPPERRRRAHNRMSVFAALNSYSRKCTSRIQTHMHAQVQNPPAKIHARRKRASKSGKGKGSIKKDSVSRACGVCLSRSLSLCLSLSLPQSWNHRDEFSELHAREIPPLMRA